MYLKKLAHPFFGAWLVLLIHIQCTLSEGPKGFVNSFLKKLDHGSWTIKSDHGKIPPSMVWFHGPWCKPALIKWGLPIPKGHYLVAHYSSKCLRPCSPLDTLVDASQYQGLRADRCLGRRPFDTPATPRHPARAQLSQPVWDPPLQLRPPIQGAGDKVPKNPGWLATRHPHRPG